MNTRIKIAVKLIAMCLLAGIGVTCAFLQLWGIAGLALVFILVGVVRVVSLSRQI